MTGTAVARRAEPLGELPIGTSENAPSQNAAVGERRGVDREQVERPPLDPAHAAAKRTTRVDREGEGLGGRRQVVGPPLDVAADEDPGLGIDRRLEGARHDLGVQERAEAQPGGRDEQDREGPAPGQPARRPGSGAAAARASRAAATRTPTRASRAERMAKAARNRNGKATSARLGSPRPSSSSTTNAPSPRSRRSARYASSASAELPRDRARRRARTDVRAGPRPATYVARRDDQGDQRDRADDRRHAPRAPASVWRAPDPRRRPARTSHRDERRRPARASRPTRHGQRGTRARSSARPRAPRSRGRTATPLRRAARARRRRPPPRPRRAPRRSPPPRARASGPRRRRSARVASSITNAIEDDRVVGDAAGRRRSPRSSEQVPEGRVQLADARR